ncbi:hypothetical protein EV182_005697 [Spiromyces aspiralis]|uniref:Uncharacterized protein n=1 Tax=Spiromyces aspiralis TaxID=68401 RepID=A0ACC1HBX0_9FUNG|nr:hypothetical protein EV182_005697 [Spiromyces aspiralis]
MAIPENMLAEGLQIRHGTLTVTHKLKEHSGDQGNRLACIEPHAPGQAPLSEEPDLAQL